MEILFLLAVGLGGAKISNDFGNRGLRGYGMLLIYITILSALVGLPYI